LPICQGLVKIGKSTIYPLIDILIWLILVLSILMTITERAFSTMTIAKIRLHNRMKDDFLVDYLIVYVKKDIVERFSINMIINYFYSMKK
jgi:hypothetical protein